MLRELIWFELAAVNGEDAGGMEDAVFGETLI